MKITNAKGYPEALVRAVLADPYSRGVDPKDGQPAKYSATDLISPVQQVILKRRHADEIEVDVESRIWALFGQAVHHVLERAGDENHEVRLYADYDGVKVSGQMDFMGDGHIRDWKVTSAWTLVFKDRLPEWEKQLNIYAALARANGKTVESLAVIAILRDWSKTEAARNQDYPQAPVVEIPLRLWDQVDAHNFVRLSIGRLEVAALQPDPDLPRCLPDEMWEKPTKYAVMKPGQKSAVRVFDEKALADQMIHDNPKYELVTRPGERARCAGYCEAAAFCSQWKRHKGEAA